jgi:uncharacterized protein (UPF0261 family)
MPKSIAIISTLDTKGAEANFLRQIIEEHGHTTLVIDPGVLNQPTIAADISRDEVAHAGGASLEELASAGDKGHAIMVMTDGVRSILLRLYAQGMISGAIAIGGGQGTAIGTAAMQALPIGVPKLMLSTIASGRSIFEPYVGTTDMTLMHSVADIAGLNSITRQVLANAGAAISAMAASHIVAHENPRPVIGTTMLGLTTGCVMEARAHLESWGYEVITFHPNGTGGRCLERLVDEGLIQGVLDLSTQELTGYICHGLFDAGMERMLAAGRRGLPQVVAPGGTDYIVLGPLSSLTAEQRQRPRVIHNANITLVRTSAPEMRQVGSLMAQRLNASTGVGVVLVPTRGFSYSDTPGGAFYDPEADGALIEALLKDLDSRIKLELIDAHINDPHFALVAAETMRSVMEKPASS